MPDVCLSFVLLFTIFIIVVTQKLVLQQSKNDTAKCTKNPPPCILYLLGINDIQGCINFTQRIYNVNLNLQISHRSHTIPGMSKKDIIAL